MSNVAASLRMSEPHPHSHLHAAHLVDGLRQAELRALHDRIPTREHWMDQQIARIDARIEIEGVLSSDGVSTNKTPKTTNKNKKHKNNQMSAILAAIDRCSSQIGAQ